MKYLTPILFICGSIELFIAILGFVAKDYREAFLQLIVASILFTCAFYKDKTAEK